MFYNKFTKAIVGELGHPGVFSTREVRLRHDLSASLEQLTDSCVALRAIPSTETSAHFNETHLTALMDLLYHDATDVRRARHDNPHPLLHRPHRHSRSPRPHLPCHHRPSSPHRPCLLNSSNNNSSTERPAETALTAAADT